MTRAQRSAEYRARLRRDLVKREVGSTDALPESGKVIEEKVEPMAVKIEQRKEYAYLVRELDAFCARKFPSDVDRRYREALEKRLWQLLPDLDVPQLVRMIEATCGVDFPSAVDRNFHDAVMERLGRAHHLKDVRGVVIPGHWVADRKGRAVPAAAAAPVARPKA